MADERKTGDPRSDFEIRTELVTRYKNIVEEKVKGKRNPWSSEEVNGDTLTYSTEVDLGSRRDPHHFGIEHGDTGFETKFTIGISPFLQPEIRADLGESNLFRPIESRILTVPQMVSLLTFMQSPYAHHDKLEEFAPLPTVLPQRKTYRGTIEPQK